MPSPRSLLLAATAALLALASPTSAAYDFSAKPALSALTGCTPQQPGTSAPLVDASRTNMTKASISAVASTKFVTGRKIVMYLGKDASSNTCFADSFGDAGNCKYDLVLQGTWQGLRGCGWSLPDTISRPGYEVRNNTVYLEWQDLFPGGNRQTSRYAYPVSIALPTTVNVETNVKILEDSGIKNFNVTGLSFDTSGTGRKLIVDFAMNSRWPNNLTLAQPTPVTLPGFPGTVTISTYNLPTCVKTDGTNSTTFTTDDFCYQSGELVIDVGSQCDAGGVYAFNFDTNCFPGTNNVNSCKGKVLSANAYIGSPDDTGKLVLQLCGGLYATAESVTAEMVASIPSKMKIIPYTLGAITAQPTTIGPALDALKVEVVGSGSMLGGPSIANGIPQPAGVFLATDYPQTATQRHYLLAVYDYTLVKMALMRIEVLNGVATVYRVPGGGYFQPPTQLTELNGFNVNSGYANRVPYDLYEVVSLGVTVTEIDPTTSSTTTTTTTPTPTLVGGKPRRLERRQDGGGYFFGQTVELIARFNSPGLPLYESRLIKLILGRNIVLRTPNGNTAQLVRQNQNVTMVESAAGPSAVGALKPIAENTVFTYTPGSTEVHMSFVPNMKPRDNAGNYPTDAFLSTDDFDSISDYTFYATFRVYFDQASAAGQRRRRLLTRDVQIPSSRVGRSSSVDSSVTTSFTSYQSEAPIKVSQQQTQTTVTATTSSSSNDTVLMAVAITLGVLALLTACCTIGVFCWPKKKRDSSASNADHDAFLATSSYARLGNDMMASSSKMPDAYSRLSTSAV